MAPVIVTRPGAAGRQLVERLCAAGIDALWCPAFDIEPIEDAAPLDAALNALAAYDLAIFVSQPAVRVVGERLPGRWPISTAIAVVGDATRSALSAIAGSAQARVIAPVAESGAEALWESLRASGLAIRRVLVFRAEHGRDWLIERLAESGALVEVVAVYRRTPLAIGADSLGTLQRRRTAGDVPITLFSSSEAVAALDSMLGDQWQPWLRQGTALATHPRIADRLRAAGYRRVQVVTNDDAINATIESLRD